MKKNTIIDINQLSKIYKLYDEPVDRLKEAINPFKKKYHKDFYALQNISFTIEKGEIVGIIGRNGSGKSTLLKIITGVLTANSGYVNVNGKISAILELGAGFNPELTGVENIYLNTYINGLDKKEIDKKIDEIIEFSELGTFIHQPLKTYSSGMKARLGFAVAINVEPDILIVDEALAVGDAAFQRKCFSKMEEIKEAGVTILFVSHSAESIVSLCSRAIWLSNGEKVIEGEPKLVTGLYMKNSNKKEINKKNVINEFEKLKVQIEKKDVNKPKKIDNLIENNFNKAIKPKSTISYEENGAKIDNVVIRDENDIKVNILYTGNVYRYCYDVIYQDDFENVRLGMVIKTTKGIPLVAGQYPYNKTKNGIKVKKNQSYKMVWEFKCMFGEGNYFTNCGTFDIKTQTQLHRITDSYMFKVVKKTKDVNAGIVTLLENGTLNEL